MDFFANTDIGRKRKVNQDNYCVQKLGERAVLCAVFDGMGGHAGGETASSIACDKFRTVVTETLGGKLNAETGTLDATKTQIINVLEKAASVANTAIYEASHESDELSGMGTTLVAILINGDIGYAINIGDSRIYSVCEGKIEQVTRDHSYVQYLIDLGEITEEEAKTNANKSIITRAVGTESEVEADSYTVDCESVRILLCSDGLSNHIDNAEIGEIISKCENAESAINTLIDKANENGGSDNITAILIITDGNAAFTED